MSDQEMNTRTQMIEGGPDSSGRGRTIAGIALFGAVGVAVYLVLAPASVDTSGPDTSQTQNIQSPETTPGVDTGMPVGQPADQPDTSAVSAVIPLAPRQVPIDDDGDADRQRIAALERELATLRDAQGNDGKLEAALQDMESRLNQERADADARYQALLAQLTQNAGGNTGMSEDEREARRRLEEERQRRAAIAEAQIMSDGIVLDGSGAKIGAGGEGQGPGRTLSSNEQFIGQASTQSYKTARATQIANPGRTILQGTMLNAVLETAVSSELPGVIRAVVTDDVMSYDGMNVLIPQGSRLIGSYNSDVSVIQNRVQIAWNRAVTPSGVSVELGGYGADALGMSGQAGTVDTRFRQRFGSAALISLMGAGPGAIIKKETPGDAADAVHDVGDDLASATQGIVGDYLSAGPVIYIDQGTDMTVLVNRDLVL